MVMFHEDLFRSVVLYFIVIAAWGLFQWFRGQQPSGSYLGALILGEGLIVVQALSGLLLIATHHHPSEGLHWLYGAILLLAMPVVFFAWAGKADDRRASLYYALGAVLVVVVAAVRAQYTG